MINIRLNMRVLLATPPMIQLNTPYPATAYLMGYLRKAGTVDARQADPAIELVCRLFSIKGLARVKEVLDKIPFKKQSDSVQFFLEAYEDYSRVVEPVVRFLQGRDPSLALRLSARALVPEGPRFQVLAGQHDERYLAGAFGQLGVQDRAQYIASLFIDDLADVIREGVDPEFALSRYGERLAASQASFGHLEKALESPPTLIAEMLEEITNELIDAHQPDLLALTAPFPGNVLGALRIAKAARARHPKIKIALGGGYVNTELRDLQDPRIFDFVDFITLDDGERPLELLIQHLAGKHGPEKLLRTFTREEGKLRFHKGTDHDIPFKDSGIPTYDGLPLEKYFSILEMLNPMHRIWSAARWNKVTLAHGCYWKKCGFCDINLDYIGRYDAASADLTIDRMQSLQKETGQSGFHFVDEAAPPALLKNVSRRLIERKITASWWGNIRFESAFTPTLARLMADSGCIAVSGGLEVASDRLLKLMNKGVTVEQVARVTYALRQAGILVHAYLMYGFPTQTEQETIDSLERVRQLFEQGCLTGAYWHRFSATAHSPIGRNPKEFGIELLERKNKKPLFARNDLEFVDSTGCDHDALGRGLRKALYNYMHGVGLDTDVREWFDQETPRTKVPRNLIASALSNSGSLFTESSQRV